MNISACIYAIAFGLCSTLVSAASYRNTTYGMRNVGYYANGDLHDRNFSVLDIDSSQWSHIVYAFMGVDGDTGEVFLTDSDVDRARRYPGDDNDSDETNLYGNLKQMYLLKKKHRSLKTMYSIGGWGQSQNTSKVLANMDARINFAKTAVDLMGNYGFDGINIDYEYVANSTEAIQMADLLSRLRSALNEYTDTAPKEKSPYLISYASPAGPAHYTVLNFKLMDQYVDFWDLMAFNYAGSWSPVAAHAQNLFPSPKNETSTPFNTKQAVEYMIEQGISPRKINMGQPLFGTSFKDTDGPGKSFNATDDPDSPDQGTWDYNEIHENKTLVVERFDIGASYSYDPVKRYMISYDTPAIARQKARWAKYFGLGGSMVWDIAQDKPGNSSLVATAVEAWGGKGMLDNSTNHLRYPKSQFKNLRAQFAGQ